MMTDYSKLVDAWPLGPYDEEALASVDRPSESYPFQKSLRQAWGESGLPLSVFLDHVAFYVASEFNARRLSFAHADQIANDLFHEALFTDHPVPGHSYLSNLLDHVYSAFDRGEWSHPEMDRNDDPIEKYTRPHIALLLVAGRAV